MEIFINRSEGTTCLGESDEVNRELLKLAVGIAQYLTLQFDSDSEGYDSVTCD